MARRAETFCNFFVTSFTDRTHGLVTRDVRFFGLRQTYALARHASQSEAIRLIASMHIEGGPNTVIRFNPAKLQGYQELNENGLKSDVGVIRYGHYISARFNSFDCLEVES